MIKFLLMKEHEGVALLHYLITCYTIRAIESLISYFDPAKGRGILSVHGISKNVETFQFFHFSDMLISVISFLGYQMLCEWGLPHKQGMLLWQWQTHHSHSH